MEATLQAFARDAAAHVKRLRAATGAPHVALEEDAAKNTAGPQGSDFGERREQDEVEVEYRFACTRESFDEHVATLRRLLGEPEARTDTVLYVSALQSSPVRCTVVQGRVERVDTKTDLCTAILGSVSIGEARVNYVAKCSLEAKVPEAVRRCAVEASEAFCAPPAFERGIGTDAPPDAFLLAHWDELPLLRTGVCRKGLQQFVLLPGCVGGTHFAFGAVAAWVGAEPPNIRAKRRERLSFRGKGFRVDCTKFRLHRGVQYNIEVEMDPDSDLHFPPSMHFLFSAV